MGTRPLLCAAVLLAPVPEDLSALFPPPPLRPVLPLPLPPLRRDERRVSHPEWEPEPDPELECEEEENPPSLLPVVLLMLLLLASLVDLAPVWLRWRPPVVVDMPCHAKGFSWDG